MNRRAKYLGQRSFHSKVIVQTCTDTHTAVRLRDTAAKTVARNR